MNHQAMSPKLDSGVPADVLRAGSGPALVYFHGRLGRIWNDYLDGLSEYFQVHAPLHPGVNDEDDLAAFDSVHDLALYYDDLLNALDIGEVVIVGHGFGGMVAAEYAAHFPGRVTRLVLIGSLGLWDDDEPVADIDAMDPDDHAACFFHDPESEVVQAYLQPDASGPEARTQATLQRLALIAATNHFIWPIPDRNLSRRLHRIVSPTLLLWGAEDRYVPPRYGERFAKLIADSDVVRVARAGNHPHVEQPAEALRSTLRFLT